MSLVENILDSDLYKLWLEKVTMATTDVPEFQSWLSLRNLDVHRPPVSRRLTPKARSFIDASGGAADITLPDSINLQAKNLFYSDVSYFELIYNTHNFFLISTDEKYFICFYFENFNSTYKRPFELLLSELTWLTCFKTNPEEFYIRWPEHALEPPSYKLRRQAVSASNGGPVSTQIREQKSSPNTSTDASNTTTSPEPIWF